MATDPNTLTDPQQLRTLAANARERSRDDIAFACMVRIAELAGQIYEPGIEQEFWEAITIAEELRTAENGKTTRLSRTRQKIARVGIFATVRDLAKAAKPSEGFRILVDGGRPDMTAEAIVLRHPEQFEHTVTELAKSKLQEAGVTLDRVLRVTAGV